jgi:hypothetical protein
MLAASRDIIFRQFIARLRRAVGWPVKNLKRFRNRSVSDFHSPRQPFFMLQMGELFRHRNINELIQGDALLQREVFGHPADRRHEPEWEFIHSNFFLTRAHELQPFFLNSLSSSAGVSTRM